MTMNNVPDHLGGHMNKTHVDRGTLEYIHNRFDIKSMFDIGCGPGGMYYLAKEFGIDYSGFDGDPSFDRIGNISITVAPMNVVTIIDFTKDRVSYRMPAGTIDLAWSVEFLEHVEERFMDNYMSAFRYCKYVVATAAPPGYPGHHHVNCRTEEYWHGAFAANGFKYNHKITQEIRDASTMAKPFMQRTGMFFERM